MSGVLRAQPGQGAPLTGEALENWKQQMAKDAADYVSGAKFPLLGLDDSWKGTRWVGGSTGSAQDIKRVELMHGGREDAAQASVDIGVRTDGIFSLRSSLDRLMWELWREHDDGLEYLQAAIRDDLPLGLWEETAMYLNGEKTTAHSVSVGTSDVVLVETDELIISVVCRGIAREDIRLVDVDPLRYTDVYD